MSITIKQFKQTIDTISLGVTKDLIEVRYNFLDTVVHEWIASNTVSFPILYTAINEALAMFDPILQRDVKKFRAINESPRIWMQKLKATQTIARHVLSSPMVKDWLLGEAKRQPFDADDINQIITVLDSVERVVFYNNDLLENVKRDTSASFIDGVFAPLLASIKRYMSLYRMNPYNLSLYDGNAHLWTDDAVAKRRKEEDTKAKPFDDSGLKVEIL